MHACTLHLAITRNTRAVATFACTTLCIHCSTFAAFFTRISALSACPVHLHALHAHAHPQALHVSTGHVSPCMQLHVPAYFISIPWKHACAQRCRSDACAVTACSQASMLACSKACNAHASLSYRTCISISISHHLFPAIWYPRT